ncbi:MAG: hypothetical protein KF789_03185 [Bdellovibrionaceae bacterium]|nr:hypothetical protein [Pseudobdellovibrionaceae bacterium]
MGLRSLTFISCLIASSLAIASGGEKAAEKSSPPPEWVEIQSRLQVLKAKMGAKEKMVRDLIADKHRGASHESFEHLKREHAELRKLSEEYEQQRNVLRYRYPEKGLKDGRKYQRVEVKSLTDMENQIGMEAVLQKTQNKMHRQYGASEEDSARTPASAGEARPAAPLNKSSSEEGVTTPSVMSK